MIDVAAIRRRLGHVLGERPITQEAFARRFGFSLAAVRDREQKRCAPDPASRVLLLLIDRDPHLVDAVIDEAIERAAVDRERVEAPDFEIEVVRPSSLPFVVQRLGRRRRRRGGAAV